MRIGYLLQVGEEIRRPPFNGPANHVRQVIQELCRRGHDVKVLFRLEGQIWESVNLTEFEPVTIKLIDRGLLRLVERFIRRVQYELKLPYLGFFESLRFALACQQELAECDLYFERFAWMTYGGAMASRWRGIPWILEYNGDPLADLEAKNMAPKGLQRRLSVGLMNWAFQQVSHVVASGEGWRRSAIRTWGVSPDKVTTIENGTDLVRLLKREQLRSFRVADSCDESTHLVYLGGFYRWHGITILLRALERVVQLGVTPKLILIGAGDGLEDAQQLAHELGLENLVQFLGRLASGDYAPILADSDIGLSPYCGWEEYSGLKIFDYKAAGLACIASGQDGQPVTLKHGQTGWIVPPCDEDALVDAILKLSADIDLRRRMGQAARMEAEQSHGWEHTVDRLEPLFSMVIRR